MLVLFPALADHPTNLSEIFYIFNLNLEVSLGQIRDNDVAGWCIFDDANFIFKTTNSIIINNNPYKWRFILGLGDAESGRDELIFKCKDYIFMKNYDGKLNDWSGKIYKDLCNTLDFTEVEKILSPNKSKLNLLNVGDCYYYRTNGEHASLIKGTLQYLQVNFVKQIFLPN